MAAHLSPDSELVYYFKNGVNALVQKDFDRAGEHFHWCRDQISAEQADVHRALAWLDSTTATTSTEHIEAMYTTRGTWGHLLTAAGRADGRPLPVNMFEARVMVIPELDVKPVYRIPEVAALGYGAALTDQGRFEEASTVLSSTAHRLPMLALARMHLFVKTHRWVDVIDAGQSILNPHEFNKDGEELDQLDPAVSAVSNLFIGTAHAHLGNFAAARQHLEAAGQQNYRDVGVEGCYIAGLMDRHEGNENAAITRLNAGQAFKKSDKLAAAAADPGHRLKLTTPELINQRSAYWDHTSEPDLEAIREVEREERKGKLLAEAEAELARQIGMGEVKEQVRARKDKMVFVAEAARRGVELSGQSLHMAFTGPPGTGKTTMARVIAKIYCGIGLLKNETVLEVGREDLVGAVIGETEAKTAAVIDAALDGVLFIDEAYSLVAPGSKNDFGLTAVNGLLARMDTDRHRLVVIVAGYEKDINSLLSVNEGLGSRFAHRIRFHSYSPEEIGDIAAAMATDRSSILPPEAKELIVSETRSRMMVPHPSGHLLLDVAGNGRFVRNVIERAEDYRSSRYRGQNLSALSDEELFGLSIEDVRQGLDHVINPLVGIIDNARER